MPGATANELDLGSGYSADISTEVSGEGNSLMTRVTARVGGPATRRLRVAQVDDNIIIETEGEWEATAMANLLRGLADTLNGH